MAEQLLLPRNIDRVEPSRDLPPRGRDLRHFWADGRLGAGATQVTGQTCNLIDVVDVDGMVEHILIVDAGPVVELVRLSSAGHRDIPPFAVQALGTEDVGVVAGEPLGLVSGDRVAVDDVTGTEVVGRQCQLAVVVVDRLDRAGDLEILADLRAQRLVASLTMTAPHDKGAVGRVSWLVNQRKEVNPAVVLEAYPKNAKTGPTATLGQVLEDRQALIDDSKREAFKFRIAWRRDMGMSRKSGGKNPGFIDTVLGLIDSFYGEVVQTITPWVPPAPKIKRPAQLSQDADGTGQEDASAGIDLQPSWRPSPADES
jgi:hypothetical protein